MIKTQIASLAGLLVNSIGSGEFNDVLFKEDAHDW